MSAPVCEKGQYYLAANANLQCFVGSGELIGVFVSSASGTPLLTVNDSNANSLGNTSANGNTVIAQFVPVAATFYRMPAKLLTGLNLTISGSVTCTAFGNRG